MNNVSLNHTLYTRAIEYIKRNWMFVIHRDVNLVMHGYFFFSHRVVFFSICIMYVWACVCVCVCVCVLVIEPVCALRFHWRHSKFEDIVRWYSAKTCTLTFLYHLNSFFSFCSTLECRQNWKISIRKNKWSFATLRNFLYYCWIINDFQLYSHF